MTKYTLVNPTIIGNFSSTVSAKDQNDAAHQVWNNLSEYITGNVPEFVFTLESDSDKYHTFQVKENPSGKYADFEISEVQCKMSSSQENTFKDHVKRLKNSVVGTNPQKGGKKNRRYDDEKINDDNDDSSSDSVYDKLKLFSSINNQKPIMYLWYTPLIYDLPRFYVPTFVAPLTPYVEINLSSAFLG